MLNITRDLFDAFNKERVSYCNWKGTSKIEQGLDGFSDIDILVSKDNKDKAERILTRCGYINTKTQWLYRYPDVYDWIGFDKETGKLVHVHLHYRMIAGHPGFMEYHLSWEKNVLESRVLLSNGVYTICPEWEYVTFLSRIGLEYPNKKIDKKHMGLTLSAQDEVSYLKKEIDWDRFKLILDIVFDKYAHNIFELAQKESVDEYDLKKLQKIIVSVNKGVLYNSYYKIFSILKLHINKRILRYLDNFLWIPQRKTISTGFMIAFLGQDGSGKSTVTNEIKKWLQWKLEVETFYLGSGDEHYNPWQKRLIRKLKGSKNPFMRLLRSWLTLEYLLANAKYVKKTVVKAQRFSRKGGIALFDRYPQNQYAGINDGPKIRATLLDNAPKRIRKVVEWYAQKEENILSEVLEITPTLIFKLMLSPEESLRRKPFENKELVEKKHNIVKALQYPQATIMEVSAEQKYEDELLQIKNMIWKQIIR